MANGNRPNLRLQPNVDIAGIAQLIAGKTAQEEQIRAQRSQQQQQKFGNILQAAQLGSNLAQQFSLNSRRNQAMALTQEIADISQALSSGRQVEEAGGRPSLPTEDLQQRLQSSLLQAGVPSAQKAAVAQAFPEAGQQQRAGVAQKINILKPDNTVELGFFDPQKQKFFLSSGEEAPAGSRQAFSEGSRNRFFTDPFTGERIRQNLVTNETDVLSSPTDRTKIRGIEELTLVEKDQADKIVKRFDEDKRKVLAQLSIDAISRLQAIFDTEVGAATEPLKSLIARTIAGEKGVLTDKDVLRNSGNQALDKRIKQLLRKWQSGRFTDSNRDEFQTIIDKVDEDSIAKLEERQAAFNKSLSQRFRLDPLEVDDVLLLPIATKKSIPAQPAKLTAEEEANQFFQGG